MGFGRYNEAVEKRRMCPNCRAFITISDRVCPYCGMQLGPRAVDLRASQFAESFLPRGSQASLLILAINIAFFLLELFLNYKLFNFPPSQIDSRTLILMGAKFGPFVAAGQYWRLITAGFLHGGFLHIAMNSYVMFDLVGEVEQFYGRSRLIVAYVFSTFTGFLLSLFWQPNGTSVGASAAAFGLIGIMLAMGLRQRSDPMSQAVRSYYGRWAVYAIVFSFLPGGVDIAAHLGGLAGGFAIGFLGGLPGRPGTPAENLWKILAGVAIAALLYAFFMDFLTFRMLSQRFSIFQGA